MGRDADLTFWDPQRKTIIEQAGLHHGSDYTPYEGRAVTGWPVSTMLRGKFVVRDGMYAGEKGRGEVVGRSGRP